MAHLSYECFHYSWRNTFWGQDVGSDCISFWPVLIFLLFIIICMLLICNSTMDDCAVQFSCDTTVKTKNQGLNEDVILSKPDLHCLIYTFLIILFISSVSGTEINLGHDMYTKIIFILYQHIIILCINPSIFSVRNFVVLSHTTKVSKYLLQYLPTDWYQMVCWW